MLGLALGYLELLATLRLVLWCMTAKFLEAGGESCIELHLATIRLDFVILFGAGAWLVRCS